MCIAEWCHFSDIHISQGSVSTWLRRGGIFKHEFVANLLLSPLVKKFWKSGNSWWNYGQEFGVLFFLTHGVHQMLHESKSVCVSVSLCSVFSADLDQTWHAASLYHPHGHEEVFAEGPRYILMGSVLLVTHEALHKSTVISWRQKTKICNAPFHRQNKFCPSRGRN